MSLVNRQQTGLDPHHCTTFCNLIPAKVGFYFLLFMGQQPVFGQIIFSLGVPYAFKND